MRHDVDDVCRPDRDVEVERGEAIGSPGRLGVHRGEQRRGVGGEDRPGRAERVELGEDPSLELGVLGHALDQQVGVRAGRHRVRGHRHPGERPLQPVGVQEPVRLLLLAVAAQPAWGGLAGGGSRSRRRRTSNPWVAAWSPICRPMVPLPTSSTRRTSSLCMASLLSRTRNPDPVGEPRVRGGLGGHHPSRVHGSPTGTSRLPLPSRGCQGPSAQAPRGHAPFQGCPVGLIYRVS